MATHVDQLLQQALQLPDAQREQIAEQLYLSLHTSAEVDAAWSEEIAKRIEQVDSGNVPLLSAEQVHQQIQELIDRERPGS